MNKKPILLIDMDDTLTDLLNPWLDYLNKKYNLNKTDSDVTDWDISIAFKKEIENGIMTIEDIYRPLYDNKLYNRVFPIPYAFENLKKLNNDYEIFICTATHFNIASYKFNNVLLKYFPFIKSDQIITTTRKDLIRGDILIDDSYKNIISFPGYRIMLKQPHNKNRIINIRNNEKIRIANDWNEIYYYVKEIEPLLYYI